MTSPIRIDERTLAIERLWGAKSIADFIGCTVDHVYDLEKHPSVPIFKPPGTGRYLAYKSELTRWMRTKSTAC